MKKILSILLASATALSVCGGLAACGGDDNSKTLTVWAPSKAVSCYKKLADDFKKANSEYKDWTIKVIAHEEKTIQDDLAKDVANAGDIFFFPSDQLWSLIHANAISQLPDSYYDIVMGRDNSTVIDYARNGDSTKKPYAYPATNDNGYVVYYDKTKCNATDVLSLENLQEKAKSSGYQFIFPYQDGFYASSLFISASDIQFEYIDENHSTYKTNVDEAKGQAIMTAMVNYFGKDKNQQNSKLLIATASPDDSLQEGFYNSNILGGIGGTWLYNDIVDAIEENLPAGKSVEDVLGITVLPTFTYTYNGTPVTVNMHSWIGYKYCGVNAQKPQSKQKAAHALASYLTSYEGQAKRFEATHAGPSNNELAAELSNDPILKVFEQQRQYGRIQNPQFGTFWDGSATLMTQITSGDITSTNMEAKLKAWADQLEQNI